MTIGKRKRFEILKRDGFRCRYCGAGCLSTVLEVDHVVPVAEGGTDDPANLVAACHDCNSGKSAVPLEDSRLERGRDAESIREQTRQVKGYLSAIRELEAAKFDVLEHLCVKWTDLFGNAPPKNVQNRMLSVVERVGFDVTVRAMVATYTPWVNGRLDDRGLAPYFFGVLRAMRQEGKA